MDYEGVEGGISKHVGHGSTQLLNLEVEGDLIFP
jgi:hypothetical protein